VDLVQTFIDDDQPALAEMLTPRPAELVHLLELDPGHVHGEVVEAVLVRLVADHEHRIRGEDVEILAVGKREPRVVREGHVRHAGPGVDLARVFVGLVLGPHDDEDARVVRIERLHGAPDLRRGRLAGPQLARNDRPHVERMGAGLVVERRPHLQPDVLQRGRNHVAVLGPLRLHRGEEFGRVDDHATISSTIRSSWSFDRRKSCSARSASLGNWKSGSLPGRQMMAGVMPVSAITAPAVTMQRVRTSSFSSDMKVDPLEVDAVVSVEL
jgi:hypothetical protein